jgi:hypothetical protein
VRLNLRHLLLNSRGKFGLKTMREHDLLGHSLKVNVRGLGSAHASSMELKRNISA